jgi:Spy/CpxP family protein refolding chaperone
MSELKKNRSTRGLKAVAAAAVIALAGGAGMAAWAQGPHGMGGHGHHVRAMHGGGLFMGSPERIDRLLDGLNATDAQRTQIKQIARAAAEDLKAQRQQGQVLRDKAATVFTAPTVDAAAAESLRQQMLAQHDAASRRVTQAMVDAANVLTPEQRAKLGERMQERKQRMQERRQRMQERHEWMKQERPAPPAQPRQ